eukprot:sb/3473202/
MSPPLPDQSSRPMSPPLPERATLPTGTVEYSNGWAVPTSRAPEAASRALSPPPPPSRALSPPPPSYSALFPPPTVPSRLPSNFLPPPPPPTIPERVTSPLLPKRLLPASDDERPPSPSSVQPFKRPPSPSQPFAALRVPAEIDVNQAAQPPTTR